MSVRYEVGQSHRTSIEITPSMVRLFSDATGDCNPIHVDEQFAATTPFGRPIAHGVLLLGLVSRVLGTEFPGPGTIYTSQDVRFRRPVYVGDHVTVLLTIIEVILKRSRLRISTEILNSDEEPCLLGTAEVLLPATGKESTE